MDNRTLITAVLLVFGLGIGLAIDTGTRDTRPEWVQDVRWLGEVPDNSAKIEELLWLEISPYKTTYESVNISAKGEKNELNIEVTAISPESNDRDIYEFSYDNNELVLTGYLLESIPSFYRNEAIGIALNDRDVSASIQNPGEPAVKRILPGTSRKFYAPKILLSVTWKGISALVDPDERKIVQVWKEGGN